MLCIIPARGGSKGVKDKNIRNIAGKPLLAWSIEQALECELIDRVIVSTESQKIAAIAEKYGAKVPFLRPEALARDDSPTEPSLIYSVEELGKQGYYPKAVILLQPTSPIRNPGRLKKAIELFNHENADSLVSVCEEHPYFWKDLKNPTALYNYNQRLRRQDIKPKDRWYQENGSIYITKTKMLIEKKNRLCGKIVMFQMEKHESLDLDTVDDFTVAEAIIRKQFF